MENKKGRMRKDELVKQLALKGVTASGNCNSVAKLATEIGIATVEEEPVIQEGWVGKPKGIYQVLWERLD
jgi:hypothetical protein